MFLAARPNPGAGIGHQMANWIAGYWYARQFGLQFAHIPFAPEKWERFLGFGAHESNVSDLRKNGYKMIRIPLFDEANENEVRLVKKIIDAYGNKKVVFICEQDQYYKDQFGVTEDLRQKFYNAESRAADQLVFNKAHFNIALHVRRGDIVAGKDENPNLQMRFQDNAYFVEVLKRALAEVKENKTIDIYLFSQGQPEDFKAFNQFDNLHLCLDMNAMDSFLHMVYADALITSKSSFSYKPALLNRGVKYVPDGFWHGYPEKEDWVLIDENRRW
ncbi:MAG: hypothetical protein QM610_05120 [Chitinophagaceae bacterium]